MIRWVFLDVGNVLFNDDPLTFLNHLRHYEAVERLRPGFSFAEFLAGREREILAGAPWPLYAWMKSLLAPAQLDALWIEVAREAAEHYDELHPLLAGAEEMIESLARRFRLGLLANQMTECRASLARRGLLDCFEVVALSAEVGLHKPDPELFRWAVRQAGAEPRECVMVGDRHDNDIVPAGRVGMRSVWLRWNSWVEKGWNPVEPRARMYLESIQRASLSHRVLEPNVREDARSVRLEEIAPAVAALAAGWTGSSSPNCSE